MKMEYFKQLKNVIILGILCGALVGINFGVIRYYIL